jgi:hypothetical protein
MEAAFSVNGSGNRIYPVPIGNDEFSEGFLWKFTGYCVRSYRPATQVIQSDIGSDGMRYGTDRNPIGIFPNPMIRQKSDRNPGDDPTDGSVVLDPIGSYSRIRYFYRSIVF